MSILDPRRSWLGFLAVAGLALALALTALEPASSQGLGVLPRLVFWALHNAAALVLLSVAQLAITRTRWLGRASPLLQVALAGVLGAVLFTPVALGLDTLFAFLSDTLGDDPSLVRALAEEFAALAPPLWLIWGLLNAPRLVHLREQSDPAMPAPEQAVTAAPLEGEAPPASPPDPDTLAEFWGRVPPRIGRDIVALTAELHYLRVYTTRGEALIFMAFGRAVDALAAERGFQIHRSHWVALAHVAEFVQTDGKAFCVLDTGLRLPVSRANRAAFRAALQAAPSRS